MKAIVTLRKTITALTILLLPAAALQAQNPTRDAIVQAMQGLYSSYDNVTYLSFDVKFSYGSDTLLGKFDNEQMDASYTLAGKKARYRLGDIDFLQNDSFFIAVYNRDKIILVDEPRAVNVGSQLPMRYQIDSLLEAYSDHYALNIDTSVTESCAITLTGIDSLAQLSLFSLTYDNANKLIKQISYEFNEPAELDTAVLAALRMAANDSSLVPVQKKRFTIQFLNYRLDNYDEAGYNENNYIWFENNVCKPAAKYEDYKIYYSKPQRQFLEEAP
ncbi:MAG: hypothetical protein QM687_11765 [Ferruginibacter sp.]